MASACALLERSDDELEAIGYAISNPLLPVVACTLAACCRNLCRVMQVPLAALKERHAAARVLANKVGSNCTELLETHIFSWHDKDLTPDDVATLGMLLSSCALPRLKQLSALFLCAATPQAAQALGQQLRRCGRARFLHSAGLGRGFAPAVP